MGSSKDGDPWYILGLIFAVFWVLIGLGWMVVCYFWGSGPRINPF